jgi:hypothetical protein
MSCLVVGMMSVGLKLQFAFVGDFGNPAYPEIIERIQLHVISSQQLSF